jgi:site-specific recombinase XerD
MLEDLCRHNYAPRTRQTYVAQIAKLAKHFGVSPDQLTREQVQEYQDLLASQGVSWLPQAVAAMQFLYNKTLQRDWTIAHSPRRKAKRLPVVLTPEEVSRLLAAVEPLKLRVLLTDQCSRVRAAVLGTSQFSGSVSSSSVSGFRISQVIACSRYCISKT